MINLPKCEQYKKEFIDLCDSHDVKYNIETTDSKIIIHAKIERDFANREHLNNGRGTDEDNT